MYRISVTTLEKFRRFIKDESSYDTEESLLDTIKGLFFGNDKTRFGSAFGKIIECGDELRHTINGQSGYMYDNIFFNEELAAPALNYRKNHPKMVFEVPVSKIYKVRGSEVYVSGRLDGIEGILNHDVKTKFSQPDFSEYFNSYQWRYYLDMLNGDFFYYDVFEIKGFDCLSTGITILDGIGIIPMEPMYCARYDGMTQDCEILLNQFFEYIEQRDLFKFLKTINK